MANTSATGGYLQPVGVAPPYTDNELDAIFQKAVVGITGLTGQYVRPRWQGVSPVVPERSVDWCSISVETIRQDDSPVIEHYSPAEGSDHYARHEDITFLSTFYGENAMRYATKLKDGLTIPQNLEILKGDGIAFIDSEPLRSVPELFNQQWIKRYDLRCRFRRKVTRVYPILNLLAAEVEVYSDRNKEKTLIADIIINKE